MNLYVGNLNYDVNEDKLSDLFSSFGNVSSVKIIMDKYTGRSKGFGFVTFDDDGSANEAIKKLNDTDFEGRKLKVNEARPKNY